METGWETGCVQRMFAADILCPAGLFLCLICLRARQALTNPSARESRVIPCPAQLQSSFPHSAPSLPGTSRCRAPAQGVISVPKEGWHLTCCLAGVATFFTAKIPSSLSCFPHINDFHTGKSAGSGLQGLLQVGVWFLLSKESVWRPELLCLGSTSLTQALVAGMQVVAVHVT